jgi:hypothetical protein
MTLIEIRPESSELTLRQRWSHYFTLIYGALALLIGINLRDSTINATRLYDDIQAGIRAAYPQNWVIDTDGDYIFRVRDMAQVGFKTTIQVEIRPVSLSTTTRNLIDLLTLDRSQTLAAYTVLSTSPYTLNEREAVALQYTFVSSGDNPFLQSLPIVVEGLDILINRGGQTLIVSFLSDANRYEQNLPTFERFLADLEF